MEFDLCRAAAIFADAFKHYFSEVEAAASLAQNIGNLTFEQAVSMRVFQEVLLGGHSLWAILDAANGAAEFLAAGNDSLHAELANLGGGHDVFDAYHGAAAGSAARAADIFHPLVVDGFHQAHIALLVDEEHGACRHAADGEGDHLNLGEGAAHAVDIDHGKAQARGCSDGKHGVHAAGLDGHDRRDGLAVIVADHADELGEFV